VAGNASRSIVLNPGEPHILQAYRRRAGSEEGEFVAGRAAEFVVVGDQAADRLVEHRLVSRTFTGSTAVSSATTCPGRCTPTCSPLVGRAAERT
jgi:hypothetical protein